jgi:hypothetical protein
MLSVYRWVLVLLLFASQSSTSSGAIIVSYTGGTVSAGGSGLLNVWVFSDANPFTPDNLDSFSARFRITPIGGAVAGGLQFNDPQGDTQLGDGGYIFNTDSIGEVFGAASLISSEFNTNDLYEGGDGTLSANGVDLDNTTGTRLLFRLNLDATLASIGDQYEIKMLDDGFTQFFDPSFSPLTLHPDSFNSFTVTAVPEPASSAVAGAMVLVGWCVRKRRHRRTQSRSCEAVGVPE